VAKNEIKPDEDRKTKLRPKFDKLKDKVEAKKEQAAADFKKGSYAEAINSYKAAATLLDDALEDFAVFKKDIAQMEAAIFGNIAFCYGKDKQDKQQIEYCSKVIDRSLYIDDVSILTKAYLRRGLAYEHCEKFKLAANDLTRVRQMDPMNKQARDSITRCLKCIKQDEGIDYVPEGQDIEIAQKADDLVDENPVNVEDVKIAMASQAEPQPDPVLAEKKETDLKSLLENLTQIKERGNLQFKKKSYKEAIKHFSEAVKLFEDAGRPLTNSEIKTVVT
jgi:tetratricopeptide (TPR) repeat protein